MANISSLSTITTQATALANLILVSPGTNLGYQPQNPPSTDGQTTQQPPTFLFDYEGEQSVALESDITDHYVEDNTAIQDQIALRPEIITTHGFIGELNDIAPYPLQLLKTAADKLTVIDAYTPALSETALIAYATAFQLYQVANNALNAAVSAWSSLTGSGTQTKQQVAFQQFNGYWSKRTLFTVQTPWGVYKDMAIKSLRAVQDAETRVITDFEISFKKIRTASTQTFSGLANSAIGRAAMQASNLVNLGTSTPVSSIGLSEGLSSNYPVLGVA